MHWFFIDLNMDCKNDGKADHLQQHEYAMLFHKTAPYQIEPFVCLYTPL